MIWYVKKITVFLLVIVFIFCSATCARAAHGPLSPLGIYTGEAIGDEFAYPNTSFPFRVADINEDGFDDVIVGARYHTPSGGVYVFLGSQNISSRSAQSADIVMRDDVDKTPSTSAFGEGIAVNDLNGDGHLELIVSNYRYDEVFYNEGAGIIFVTGPNFTSKNMSQADAKYVGQHERNSFILGNVVGDVNGDGINDVIMVGALNDYKFHLYYGKKQLTDRTIDQDDVTISSLGSYCVFQYFIAGKNDVNGDGYDDIVMGCGYDGVNTAGKIYIIYGKPTLTDMNITAADVVISGLDGTFGLGYVVDTADFNRDGFDDILANGDNGAYLFLGSNQLHNMTAADAQATYTAQIDDTNCDTYTYTTFSDINNDGKQDVIASTAACGKLYVFYGDSSPQNRSIEQADLVFTGPTNVLLGTPTMTGDLNRDGYMDIVAAAGQYNSKQGRVYILTPPHGSPNIQVSDVSNTAARTVRGTVTDSLEVSAVEMSIDHADWQPCAIISGSFTCTFSEAISDGGHDLRLRSKNSYGVYMAATEYLTVNINFDHTSPQVEWTTVNGEKRTFQNQGEATAYTTNILPTFAFSTSMDASSGISKYQLLVNNNVYIDDISPTSPNNVSYWEDDRKVVSYGEETISVSPKREDGTLQRGKAYKWKVRAVDKAGNSSETPEKLLLLDTRKAVFSNIFFPLVLLNIGRKQVHISSENYADIPSSITIPTGTPTFYGIAPVNARVTLSIETLTSTKSARQVIFSSTVAANTDSRYGINLDVPLTDQSYIVQLSATNDAGDLVELPKFILNVESNMN